MVGGNDIKYHYQSQAWEYNIRNKSMTRKNDMHRVRSWFGITFDQQRREVYVLGGFKFYRLSHCEKFNTLTGEWIVIAPMNEKKLGVSACVLNSQFVFAIGGSNR